MNAKVYYFSRSGNTKKLADAIAAALDTQARDVKEQPLEEKADAVFLGASMYAGTVDPAVRAFLEANADNIGLLAVFGSSASGRSTYAKIREIADANRIALAEDSFMCLGHFLFLHKDRPGQADCAAAGDFAKNVLEKLDQ